MDNKQREIVQRLVEDGIVRPPTMTRTGHTEIRVDNSLPDNVWVMNNKTRASFIKFLHHQQMNRLRKPKLVELGKSK